MPRTRGHPRGRAGRATARRADRAVETGCRYYLSIAAVFRDEASWLREWIEFHRMMGVERFVLVDDRSSDGFIHVLGPYLESGEVELLSAPCPRRWQGRGWPTYQLAVLRAVCRRMRGISRWLALVDVDEFIVPSTETLRDFLASHEDYGGLYVRWEPFGTSYVETLSSEELLTERMHLRARRVEGHDVLGKSIVKPHRVRRAGIHRCELLPGYEYLDSNPGMKRPSPAIKVHHYWSRDEHFLVNVKLPRLSRIKGWKLDGEEVEFFRHLFNDVPDHGIDRFLPELRRRVFSRSERDAAPGV